MPEDAALKARPTSDSAPPGESPESSEPLIPATEEERRNGWTDQTLADYRRRRDLAAAEKIDWMNPNRRERPTRRAGPAWQFPARRAWRR